MKRLIFGLIAGFVFGILSSQIIVPSFAQNRFVEMPKQNPPSDNNICKCGPDCSCCDDDYDLKKKK